jgi:GNAT superfamily N-acetyltransferase
VSGYAIRAANAWDLPGMLVLYRHLNPSDPVPDGPAARQAWDAMLASPFVTVLVAEGEEGMLLATCTLVVVPNLTRGVRPYALIENVVSHDEHRRQGLGQAVMRAALGLAWQADCYKVMLATGRKDESTLRFYQSVGMVRGGKTYFEARRP